MEPADESRAPNGRSAVWAPSDVFESILKYSVMPTFDLILKGVDGVLLVRRRISPYRGLWALPGLRMLRGEDIPGCLSRIALDEVGIKIDPSLGIYINQTSRVFETRQDLSTCYAFELDNSNVVLNKEHFSDHTYVKDLSNAPSGLADLYLEHLDRYFEATGS